MDKGKVSTRPIKIAIEIDAPEAHKGEVKNFGTGGAHIIFSKDYVGYEVLVVPIKKLENAKTRIQKVGKRKR